jgi:hypothetical protein
MDEHSACTFVSLDEVVKSCLNKPITIDWAAVAEAARYYGSGIITEGGDFLITEDAEVVSIETVAAPASSEDK